MTKGAGDVMKQMGLPTLYGMTLVEFAARFQDRLETRESERPPPRRPRAR